MIDALQNFFDLNIILLGIVIDLKVIFEEWAGKMKNNMTRERSEHEASVLRVMSWQPWQMNPFSS